jgi:hypothetical protein
VSFLKEFENAKLFAAGHLGKNGICLPITQHQGAAG